MFVGKSTPREKFSINQVLRDIQRYTFLSIDVHCTQWMDDKITFRLTKLFIHARTIVRKQTAITLLWQKYMQLMIHCIHSDFTAEHSTERMGRRKKTTQFITTNYFSVLFYSFQLEYQASNGYFARIFITRTTFFRLHVARLPFEPPFSYSVLTRCSFCAHSFVDLHFKDVSAIHIRPSLFSLLRSDGKWEFKEKEETLK